MSNILNKDYNLKRLNEKTSNKEILAELTNYEKKHNYYTMLIEEEKEAEVDVEIPCEYIVGNDELEIFCNGIFLIKEISAEMEAHYREVGQEGSTSNKLQFGFNLEIGDELTIIKKGAVEDEQN